MCVLAHAGTAHDSIRAHSLWTLTESTFVILAHAETARDSVRAHSLWTFTESTFLTHLH